MRKVALLVIGLVCCSVALFAGEYLMNDTGQTVYGLRVTFSEPVRITASGDVLTTVKPSGESTEFTFTGGEVSTSGGHWLNWEPPSALIRSLEWLAQDPEMPQSIPADQVAEKPILTGDLLNPDYFSHPAYIMQGVSDHAEIFAMPLDGIEDLGVYSVNDVSSLSDIEWSVESSPIEGIEACIEDDTLFIWGSSSSWTGYGEVVLSAALDETVSTVGIPVTVFQKDRTALNSSGDTEYFVPWNMQLDINRITSVEEHMANYGKPDLGLVDRSVRFSRWRKMEYLRGANLYGWLNQHTHDAYSRKAIWMQVDETYRELARIGCDAVYLLRGYYTPERTSPCPVEVFTYWSPGLSMTDEDAAYAINEAHRQGFYVLFAPSIAEAPEGRQWYPDDLDAWFDCYADIVEENAGLSQRTGVEAYAFAHILMPAAFD